jgi:hypothetical protein
MSRGKTNNNSTFKQENYIVKNHVITIKTVNQDGDNFRKIRSFIKDSRYIVFSENRFNRNTRKRRIWSTLLETDDVRDRTSFIILSMIGHIGKVNYIKSSNRFLQIFYKDGRVIEIVKCKSNMFKLFHNLFCKKAVESNNQIAFDEKIFE